MWFNIANDSALLILSFYFRFDHVLGFLNLLVAKNIAESIPSFLREFYLHYSLHHGLATPGAF